MKCRFSTISSIANIGNSAKLCHPLTLARTRPAHLVYSTDCQPTPRSPIDGRHLSNAACAASQLDGTATSTARPGRPHQTGAAGPIPRASYSGNRNPWQVRPLHQRQLETGLSGGHKKGSAASKTIASRYHPATIPSAAKCGAQPVPKAFAYLRGLFFWPLHPALGSAVQSHCPCRVARGPCNAQT